MAKQARSEATHNHILDSAAACFAQAGYDATGVAEICARAGVTKGAFYHHFPSKQALFLELLNRWLAGLDERLAGSRAAAASVPGALLSMADAAAGMVDAEQGHLPLFLEFWVRALRDRAVSAAIAEPYRRYRRYFAALIAEGVAEGSLRPVEPEAAAQALVSFAVGQLLQSLLDRQAAGGPGAMRDGLRLLLRGLERES